jgi:hypothetical protein
LGKSLSFENANIFWIEERGQIIWGRINEEALLVRLVMDAHRREECSPRASIREG